MDNPLSSGYIGLVFSVQTVIGILISMFRWGPLRLIFINTSYLKSMMADRADASVGGMLQESRKDSLKSNFRSQLYLGHSPGDMGPAVLPTAVNLKL